MLRLIRFVIYLVALGLAADFDARRNARNQKRNPR